MTTPAFPERVLATIERHRLFSRGDRVVVAVSGGPDSMALLDALVELREHLGLSLWVAHLNHMLRGKAAAEDADFVCGHAQAFGLPYTYGTADVALERRDRGGSLEAAARRERYEFLELVAATADAQKAALGHTADDQVETVLLRLMRGGELDALRGMPVSRPLSPTSAARVVRPLLHVTRAEAIEHLTARGIGWRTDATNTDRTFLRNWLRHELLPALEARCPGARHAILSAVEAAGKLGGIVAAQAAQLVAAGQGSARLDAPRLGEFPGLVRRAALRLAYARAGGRAAISSRALDAVERLLEGGSGRELALAGGLRAERSYEWLLLRPPRRPPLDPAFSVPLTIPGRVEVAAAGLWLEASLGADATEKPSADRWEELADLDAVGEELEVRSRRPGDCFVPLGGPPTSLKRFLINQRVPRAERERLLLVTSRGQIAWVVGLRLDDRAKLTTNTRRVARLRAGPLAAGTE
ncbi:MAG: tRNA lysidine(34) synthetase TilS [Planctomycetes bacterium]|nr:tRNA lysidine(34) synthetase TilS [Planctomycetota bacterium]